MTRSAIAAALCIALALPPPAFAGIGRQCKFLCQEEIAACVAQTPTLKGARHACTIGVRRRCKRFGIETCLPTTTTSTSTSTSSSSSTSTSSTTSTTVPASRLSLLLGRWAFTYTIIDTFTDRYSLVSIQHDPRGFDYVDGFNFDLGNEVIAARVDDVVPGRTSGFEFALVDPESFIFCEVFLFNLAGASSASGYVGFLDGTCSTPTSDFYAFAGSRF